MMRFLKNSRRRDSLVGIATTSAGRYCARVSRAADGSFGFELDVCADSTPSAASDFVRGSPLALVLDPSDYRLQLLELPNVPDAELSDALRWQARDLVDYDVEEAVVDYLRVPEHATANNKPMGYAVIAKRSAISDAAESVLGRSAAPDSVQIIETCLHNVLRLHPAEANGIAFLHFTHESAVLLISREGVLHLVRRITHGYRAIQETFADDASAQEIAAGISLEVQRSLDYYESHYDCTPIQQLVLTPSVQLGELPEMLRSNLELDVGFFDLAEHLRFDSAPAFEDQSDAMLPIGAALSLHRSAEQQAGIQTIKQTINLGDGDRSEDEQPFSATFMLKSAAACLVAMALLAIYASGRVEALQADIEFSQNHEAAALEHLTTTGATIRHALGAESWDVRRELLEEDLRNKRAMLALLQGQRLGETDGFSAHMQALSRRDVNGLWLTNIELRSGSSENKLAGLVVEPELVPAYVRELTGEAPFSSQGFQSFRIDGTTDAGAPHVFALSGQPEHLDDLDRIQ